MAREFRLHKKVKGRFLNNRMIWGLYNLPSDWTGWIRRKKTMRQEVS